jgi:hypothetical protein
VNRNGSKTYLLSAVVLLTGERVTAAILDRLGIVREKVGASIGHDAKRRPSWERA